MSHICGDHTRRQNTDVHYGDLVGGALVDHEGRLVGINTAIYTQSGGSTGIGLAIPADLALRTMRDIIEYGRPVRGWLGLEVKYLEM